MLAEDDWRCPTCLDLLFKPAVNTCGHAFCFWCFHKAMSPYTPSSCPVCRCRYGQLPAICAKLHHFLAAQFPGAYQQRREETEAEEQESGGQSPEPPPGPIQPPTAPGGWQPRHFCCDHPSCGKLLCRPAVLPCGHVVCRPTCLLGSEAGLGAAAAAAPGSVPATPASPAQQDVPGGADGCRSECPACGMVARQLPAVCKQLGDLLAELFPGETAQREAEVAAHLQAVAAAAAAAGADHRPGGPLEPRPAEALQRAEQQQQQQQQAGRMVPEEEEPVTPRASAAPSEGGAAAVAAAAGDEQHRQGQGQGQAQALSPSLESALRRRQAAGGPGQALAQRLEENLRQISGEGYVHHGVGCDACGLYPIKGRRYQCRDCPEAMGFDLCGDCMDKGVSDIVGRFNQRHLPGHRMSLVRPRLTAMHMLQAANPELPMEQLMWLLELTLTGGSDEEGEEGEEGEQFDLQAELAEQEAHRQQLQQGQGQQRQGQQQQQQQQQQAEGQQEASGGGSGSAASGSDGGGGGSGEAAGRRGILRGLSGLIPGRRGPRPAYDPTAEEPSPSAYVPPPPQGAQQQAAQQAQQQQGGEAEGLIPDNEGAEVHVPLENVLPGGSRSGGGT